MSTETALDRHCANQVRIAALGVTKWLNRYVAARDQMAKGRARDMRMWHCGKRIRHFETKRRVWSAD